MMTIAHSITWMYLNAPVSSPMVACLYCFQFFTGRENPVMNILEVTLAHSLIYPKRIWTISFFSPCRGPSSSSVSSTPKIWKPLPAEALPTRPAAPEPSVWIATAEITGVSPALPCSWRQLSKPGPQAERTPYLATPAPRAGPQHLPTGRRGQEASITPPPSQVSAVGPGRSESGLGCGRSWAGSESGTQSKTHQGLTPTLNG